MKKRLDLLLVERKIFLTRSNAQVHILSGEVFVNSEKVLVSSKLIDIEAKIEIKLLKDNFVSRGGLKLEKAIKSFDINPEGMICLDVGASTGGFTDCLLKKGASKVYCVDVGYGQLDYKLRNNTKKEVKDSVSVEEPLEMNLKFKIKGKWKIENLSITMRTPGNDEDLISGFLFNERIIIRF